jgi:hypothetical protein
LSNAATAKPKLNPSLLPQFGDPNALPPLSDAQLSKLGHNPTIVSALSIKMKRLLVAIDSASSDQEKERLYDEACVYLPEFREFVKECCQTVGFEVSQV